jgi:hypothetical protein
MMQHAGGVSALIELRGPGRCEEYPEHGYLLLNRRQIIAQGLANRKRVFLDRNERRTVPWRVHPEMKTPEHHLFDILALAPGLLEEVENAGKCRR